jgi:hypothetical protein
MGDRQKKNARLGEEQDVEQTTHASYKRKGKFHNRITLLPQEEKDMERMRAAHRATWQPKGMGTHLEVRRFCHGSAYG